MSVTVLRPGPLTTVQDEGRFGFLAQGIGSAGAMDTRAWREGNALVGNTRGQAGLEMTVLGAQLRFDADTLCALTGADMPASLDGTPVPRYTAFIVRAGQTLTIGAAKSGCRGYLAAAGGIDVPPVMGSRSTDRRCSLGGFEGRALKAGDVLPVGAPEGDIYSLAGRSLPAPVFESEVTVLAVPGPQTEPFTERGLRDFFSCAYTVTPDSDRMGLRLSGTAVENTGTDIISDGIVPGAVQVPRSGQPIVLMADRQTTGGYAKIAVVCSFELWKLAQCRPGDRVRFEAVTVQQAQQLAARKGS